MRYWEELIESRRNEDCGCPEEEWNMCGLVVTLHGEGDGTGHVLIDAGDWDDEFVVSSDDMEFMRNRAREYVKALPEEG